MVTVTITISKSEVFDEVAKTTAYIGAKKVEGADTAYDRIFTTDSDKVMISRFWDESTDVVTNLLQRFVSSVSSGESYSVSLSMSSRYDPNLTDSIKSSMYSFLVNSIVAKWCEITDKDNAKGYADNAAALILDVKEKVFHKKKPTRTNVNT